MTRVFVDRFSSADHLTRKQLQDDETVLAVLRQCKRVSIFEMKGAVLSAITRLERSGKIKTGGGLEYPWIGVKVQP